MRLAEIEDAGVLATKQDLQLMAERLENLFHKELLAATRWAIIVLIGFAGIILGGVYFMLAHFKP